MPDAPRLEEIALESPTLADLEDAVRNFSATDDATRGAVLLHGFGPLDPRQFRETLADGGIEFHDYRAGNSPRRELGADVFTATEFSSSVTISMHQELSYESAYPRFLLFHCRKAAETGGATLVASSAEVTSRMPSNVARLFEDGVTYIRSMAPTARGMLQSWQQLLGVEGIDAATAALDEAGVRHSWDGEILTTHKPGPGYLDYPPLGRIWFNQADQWHPALYLSQRQREALSRVYGTALPHDVRFADGSPIPDEVIAIVTKTTLACSAPVQWRAGDILFVDNIAMMHGRASYEGSRDVVVALGK